MWLKTKTEVRIRRFGIIQIKTRKIERPPDQDGQADTHYCYDKNDLKPAGRQAGQFLIMSIIKISVLLLQFYLCA